MKMEMQSGNLFLVFIHTVSMLLIGCAIGMHWRGSLSIAICLTILGAALFVLHEVVTMLLWIGATAFFGAVRFDREPLSNPYQTHDLCPLDLCPSRTLRG
jgi:hypothetical protein